MTCCFPRWWGGCATKPPGSQLWSMCKGVILYRFRYIDQFIQQKKHLIFISSLHSHDIYLCMGIIVDACQYGCFFGCFLGGAPKSSYPLVHSSWDSQMFDLVKLSPGHPPLPKRRFPQLATLAWPDQTLVRKFQKPVCSFDVAACNERATCQLSTYWLLII